MNRHTIPQVRTLSTAQIALLKKNNFKDTSELVFSSPNELAKRLRTSLSEAQAIAEAIFKEIAKDSLRTVSIAERPDEKFTTGDPILDRAIGGGIRTGMVWEVVGESASGKTQLALQLCLLVQLRPLLGGISGSACYLTTHTKLATQRLSQLIEDHPLLSPSICDLSDIHTVAVPTIELLIRTLTLTFPALMENLRNDAVRKPVKLIVIDSISALFHTSGKSSSSTLFERSRTLSELSRIMHEIAAKHQIAFLVINEVTDVFNDHYSGSEEPISKHDILYRDQSRWFSSAHSLPAESFKEAGLGLVWANQVNTRIMLTRTNRRRYLDDLGPPAKRNQMEGASKTTAAFDNARDCDNGLGQPTLIRRLSVIFSSVSVPASVDFIVTNAGVSAVHDEISGPLELPDIRPTVGCSTSAVRPSQTVSSDTADTFAGTANGASQQFVNARIVSATLERSSSEASTDVSFEEVIPSTYPEVDEFDDEARYWEGFDEIPNDALPDIDFDGLEKSRIEEDSRPSQIVLPPVGNG